jgi:hypothetical protein
MEKYIVYSDEFYSGSWKIGVLEIITWEYAAAPPEIGSNLCHWFEQPKLLAEDIKSSVAAMKIIKK